jgi:hypothetical protein
MVMLNPAMKDRKERFILVEKTLEELLPIDFKKAIAVISINTGLSNDKCKEYVKDIVAFNDWTIEDGIIQKSIKV